ncbi:MAG: hypothetical protein RXQ56_07615 [Thermoproteus sp.]|uniref:hypothetical protein n=1 Tax=Thermoproteus sp. CP80 TaxID=1650659 RepID=UPI000749E078|nr:hypothetical protein [Thermoproteus sp. CP80]KUO84299.1 MAG: hypothetical protein AT711_05390 [Thermoproteus sp. CIS_19]KUO88614.1 MAG: hypothetical protein AT715_01885 [Thermoproteus sp. JCHS_4]MDT7869415.1 hypothetical protein [Thermoproteus sp.]MDT7881294.1 hypothetical protein [Thermoproteus sp.]PLC66003.1 hypothetical protein B7L68_02045 [Thermoproteus sp. CP80]
MDDYMELVRYLESQALYRLVDVVKYRGGRRYIFKTSIRDGEVYIHLVFYKDRAYLELWPQSFAIPMATYDLGKQSLSMPLAIVNILRRT